MNTRMKGVLLGVALILGGWLLVFLTAGAILRGILAFLDDVEDSS